MDELHYELKIPKERVAVLIGKEGKTKKDVEEATKTALDIDSNEGDIAIKGKDGLGIYTAKEVITAIGRGFNPETALLLLKVDYLFEVINLTDVVGKSKDDQLRIKGRIIGREGKTRQLIEELTETYVSVYGKTIAIIGNADRVAFARQAIEMLIDGSNHSTVYSWLERKRKELKKRDMLGEDIKWETK
jgi:ribosomal RNA assembly protein